MDITPRTAALNFKYGRSRNLGAKDDLPYGLLMRRNYYVDFEIGVDVRWNLIRDGKMDYYVTADIPQDIFDPLNGHESKTSWKKTRSRKGRDHDDKAIGIYVLFHQ